MTRLVRAAGLTSAVLASTLLATGGTAVAASAHHRGTVILHTTRAHKVTAPASTSPGVARIKNTGQPVLLARPRHGAGAATLARDLNAAAARGLIKDFTVTEAPAAATTYLRLARGSYYLADLSRESRFTAASITTLRVAGSAVSATVPKHRTFVVTHRNTLRAPASISPNARLQVRNSSTHLQEVLLWAVQKTATAAAVNRIVAKPSFNKLSGVVTGLPDTLTIMSPESRATSSHHSKAGRYLLMTLTFTSRTSEPRLTAGQVRLVTVR